MSLLELEAGAWRASPPLPAATDADAERDRDTGSCETLGFAWDGTTAGDRDAAADGTTTPEGKTEADADGGASDAPMLLEVEDVRDGNAVAEADKDFDSVPGGCDSDGLVLGSIVSNGDGEGDMVPITAFLITNWSSTEPASVTNVPVSVLPTTSTTKNPATAAPRLPASGTFAGWFMPAVLASLST
jgi:hypothetical protein